MAICDDLFFDKVSTDKSTYAFACGCLDEKKEVLFVLEVAALAYGFDVKISCPSSEE